MSDTKPQRDGVPEDYPGRIVEFPDGVDALVLQIFGVQSTDGEARRAFVDRVSNLAAGADRLERGETIDVTGIPTSMLLTYWRDTRAANDWWQSDDVTRYWGGLPTDGETGWFTERMTFPASRFNYAAGTEDRHGAAAVLPLVPCATFGYWGAYRDRLPASVDDSFESPHDRVPMAGRSETRGKRIAVSIPDNVCYIREGQGWANCADEERAIWERQMDPVIDEWVRRLGSDPAATGCLVIRDCREHDGANGAALERRTQVSFLLSLGHIEQAARTDSAHLAVHGAFVAMYTEPRFTPKMHVWVELGILKADELETEYVNCHAETGLLPYFEHRAV